MLQKCCLKIIYFLLLLSFSVIVYSPNSNANQCLKLFETTELPNADLAQHENLTTEVFKVVNVVKGVHGGERYVIETKSAWHDLRSDFTEEGGDIIGDMRANIFQLGSKASKFFGYEILDSNHMIVPSVNELNLAIKNFNDTLPVGDQRRMDITFYPTKEGLVSDEVYIREFVENGRIPISLKQRHFYHDISGHAMQGYYIPAHIIANLRSKLAIYKKFTDYLEENNFEPGIIKKLRQNITNLIDTQGNLAFFNHTWSLKRKTTQLGKKIEAKNKLKHGPLTVNTNLSYLNNVPGGFTGNSQIYIFLTSDLTTYIDSRTKRIGISENQNDQLSTMLKSFISENNYTADILADSSVVESLNRMLQENSKNSNIISNSSIFRWIKKYWDNSNKKSNQKEIQIPEVSLIHARTKHAEELMSREAL